MGSSSAGTAPPPEQEASSQAREKVGLLSESVPVIIYLSFVFVSDLTPRGKSSSFLCSVCSYLCLISFKTKLVPGRK